MLREIRKRILGTYNKEIGNFIYITSIRKP